MTNRLGACRSLLETRQLEALLLTSPTTVFYLSGFLVALYTRPVAILIDRAQPPVLVVPSIEHSIADRLHWEGQIIGYAGNERESVVAMAESLQQRGFRRVGIEPNALSMLLADGLRDAVPGIEMVDISSALEPLWWVKEEAEVVQARRAASLCVTGFAEAQRALEEGEAELIAKGRGDRAIFESAAHRFPGCRIQLFSNVISGARTAAGGGHDLPTGRTPEQGDLVFQVWAVNCEGYWALMSRTMQVGAVRDNIQVLFRAVHEAKLAALGRIRPGVTLAQIHEAAISRIPNSLDRSSVVVSVGRGVGAGIGEGPIIDAATPLPLQPGMLLRLGPEIFGPFGAIGFIDTVLVTEEGPEILSQDT